MNAAAQGLPTADKCLRVRGDGVDLAVYRFGLSSGPPLLLLHGYPDNHQIWLPLIAQLKARYQIITYDVRGFGRSEKPSRRRDYQLQLLANDLEAVILATSPSRPVHLLAHDWGSIQAWEAVTEPRMQHLLASYTTISGPCLDHVGHWLRQRLRRPSPRALLHVLKQLLRSWYVLLFHLPLLPQLAWRLGLDRHWPHLLRRFEGIDHPASNDSQRADGMYGVQLYQANFIRALLHPRQRHTRLPVHLIVPLADRFVSPALHSDLQQWAPRLSRRSADTGHWQLLAQPEQLAQWVDAYISELEPLSEPAP